MNSKQGGAWEKNRGKVQALGSLSRQSDVPNPTALHKKLAKEAKRMGKGEPEKKDNDADKTSNAR